MKMISISGSYRDGKFHSGEVVLLDKVSVEARDICATINLLHSARVRTSIDLVRSKVLPVIRVQVDVEQVST